MSNSSRREFLSDVGKGMLVAGIGSSLASDLGLARGFADEPKQRLTFGTLEPIVSIMQETPIDQLLPTLVSQLKKGTSLKDLVAAGALANARTFGGQDYTGYHAFMALPPALEIAKELPDDRKALPILKVLYRNSARIQAHGGKASEILHPIAHHTPHQELTGEKLRAATRAADMEKAEALFATATSEAFDDLQYAIQDEIDVHRVVLSWRAWTMIDLAGKEYANTLLRQSVRFCVDAEKQRLDRKRPESGIRTLLPKLLDDQHLLAKGTGTKKADDSWVFHLAKTIYKGSKDQAAEAVAMAIAEGYDPETIGEAMSMASTMLVLHDPGRTQSEEGKPKGSVHGASVGVHASDSANAWRNIARFSSKRNQIASLIVGAYHTGGQSNGQKEIPLSDRALKVPTDASSLLKLAEDSIRKNDQETAVAVVHRYGQEGHSEKSIFELLRRFAVSEDGALHAEKYYRTICEEFTSTRPSFRWQHLDALARVTASEYGFAAPGYAEACKLLKV